MQRPWWIAVVRLAGLALAVGLATSRLGLVAHELVGHGGAAIATGGEITTVQLFWFAGGWVRHQGTDAYLLISLGGVAIEALIGAVLLALARRDSLAARLVRTVGAALVVHATWYLSTGVWHGYGDGTLLHRVLDDDRWMVAVPVGLVTLAAAFLAARTSLGALAATIPGGRSARIAGTVVALALAGGVQLGAAIAEVRLRRDTTYSTIMQPERERVVQREMAQWEAAQAAPPSEDARAEMQRELAARHATFPFAIVLLVMTLLAVLAGAARARPAPPGPVANRLLLRAAALAAGSIALVIALDAAFH